MRCVLIAQNAFVARGPPQIPLEAYSAPQTQYLDFWGGKGLKGVGKGMGENGRRRS